MVFVFFSNGLRVKRRPVSAASILMPFLSRFSSQD